MHPQFPVSVDLKTLSIASSAFGNKKFIPSKYSCDGENISPPLAIGSIPEKAKSLAIILDDPDAPLRTWTHWVLWNIPPSAKVNEGNAPGTQGINDFGQNHYGGPCPPSGTHRYLFKVYALDDVLELNSSARKADLEKAMSGHIIAFGELTGLYKRNR